MKLKTCSNCGLFFEQTISKTYLVNENHQPPSKMKAAAVTNCPYCGAKNKIKTWGY